MASRRKFIQLGALASLAPITKLFGKQNVVVSKPVVLSTWNFGIGANVEAWKILSTGGRALDAVEAGARVPEGDPKETTV